MVVVLWLRTKDLGSFPKETTPQSPGAANANFAPVSLGTAITFKIRFSCNSKPAKEDSPGAAGSRTKNSGAPNASVEVQSEQRQNCPAPQDEQKSTKRKRNLDDDQDSDEEKEVYALPACMRALKPMSWLTLPIATKERDSSDSTFHHR